MEEANQIEAANAINAEASEVLNDFATIPTDQMVDQ